MDMILQFWDNSSNDVSTRYYNSKFIWKATAEDEHSKFKSCVKSLDANKMIQIRSSRRRYFIKEAILKISRYAKENTCDRRPANLKNRALSLVVSFGNLHSETKGFFFKKKWYPLHARLSSHYEAWSYKKRKHKKVKAYRKSI